MKGKKYCPDCQTWKPKRGFVNHARACYKHPGREWLHDQHIVQKRSMKAMAGDVPLGTVSDDTIAKWLDAAGIPKRRYTAPRSKKPPVTIALPAPVQGVTKCVLTGRGNLQVCWSLDYCQGLESWEPVGCEGLLDWELELAGVRPGQA